MSERVTNEPPAGPAAPPAAGPVAARGSPWWRGVQGVTGSRLFGVAVILVVLYVLLRSLSGPSVDWAGTHETLARRLGFYGVLTIGVGVLIIAGGIDLSIGSVVGLVAVLFALLIGRGVPPAVAALAVVGGGAVIGLAHGLLVAGLRLQPFIVTLCGWFIYRGLARWAAGGEKVYLNRSQVPGLRWLLWEGNTLGVPHPLLLLVLMTAGLGLFMHRMTHGRYLFAVGANEDAARYAGVPAGRYKILAYVICSAAAALGGVLFLLDKEGAQPDSAGGLLELYAITGAVLGGCSLRGGEGSVPGMFLGAAVLPLLAFLSRLGFDDDRLEYVVVGGALLIGTVADELLRRLAARRRTA